ncbi:TRAP transporter substrate-binding protein DctP [Pelobacter seleniigenes]|uniref:TRAP transporter substrate-binding protein DctP n=1 Tax=Pelobacter seleniigenes TaxID=407188 RepID=UPI0004A6EA19|nr:TRAP transporter substrate-binding protein DctP [Pelobacter seleniigenes]
MKIGQKVLAILAMVAMFAGTSFAADYNWTFQTSGAAGDDVYRFLQTWAGWVAEDSNGRIQVQVLPADAVVKYTETLDAVGANIIQGDFTDPSYFAGKDPAFSLIGNMVGAWSDPSQLFDMMKNGGGFQIFDKLLNQYNVKLLGVACTGVEAFVSKIPIRKVEDLKGVKLRAPQGMVNNVFTAVGATPVNLPGSEVYTSLEKGVIDASDYTVFATNQAQGMNDIARFPIYPGFHSMPTMQVTMNLDTWNSLPDDLKQVMRSTVDRFATYMVEEHAKLDKAAVKEAKAKGIEVISWPPEEVAKFREIAKTQWPKWSNSPIAKEWADAVAAYWDSKK